MSPTFGVIGASGFIGQRLTESLLLRGMASPRPIVRSFRSMARLSRLDLEFRMADARDATALTHHLQGCAVAFHCVTGSREVIVDSIGAAYKACKAARVKRLVYLSSAVVHGHDAGPGWDERSPLRPRQSFDYNANKVRAEKRLRGLMADGAVECVVLRPGIVFGPRSTYWTVQIARELLEGSACLTGKGAGICNTIFIDNLVDAMIVCAIHPAAAGGTYLVKDAERVTWAHLYSKIAESVGVDPASIHEVEPLPRARPWRELQRHFRSVAAFAWRSTWASAVKHRLRTPRTMAFAAAIRWRLAREDPSDTPAPGLDAEMLSLQQCRHEFSTAKIAAELEWRPPVKFEVACARTAAWLHFAFGATR